MVATSPRQPGSSWLYVGVLLCALCLAYSNSFRVGFLIDNAEIVLNDTRVHSATSEHVGRILREPYWELMNDKLYRPLTTLSFLWNYSILGEGADPTGYHVVNLAIHALNAVLAFFLALQLLGRRGLALGVASVWALHPVLTEDVTNIVGRSDLLVGFAVLAGLLMHRSILGSPLRRFSKLGALGLVAAVGVFSKESGIILVGALLLHDFLFETRDDWRASLRRGAPCYIAVAIPAAAYLAIRTWVFWGSAPIHTHFVFNPMIDADFATRALWSFASIPRYVALLSGVFPQSVDYGYAQVAELGDALGLTVGGIAFYVLCIRTAIRDRRPLPVAAFGIGLFFLALLPSSNLLFPIGATMAERFLYLPALGLLLMLGFGVGQLADRLAQRSWVSPALAVLTALAALGLGARTCLRNEDWTDVHRLWASSARAAPRSVSANLWAAVTRVAATSSDTESAVHYADRAMEIASRLDGIQSPGPAFLKLGEFYRKLGDDYAAKRSTAIGPSAEHWYRRALEALQRADRAELAWDARFQQEHAVVGQPGLTSRTAELSLELARVYARLGEKESARRALEVGRERQSLAPLLEELASIYATDGKTRQAAQTLIEALVADPSRSAVNARLVDLYGTLDSSGCSVTGTGADRSINPSCPLVHADICTAAAHASANYRKHGELREAEAMAAQYRRELGCTGF